MIGFAVRRLRSLPEREVALARYRALAPNYDAACVGIAAVRDFAISTLAARPGETIVDVGCGTGATLPGLLAQVGSRGLVIGIEQCPEMLARARRRFAGDGPPPNLKLVAAPAEETRAGCKANAYLFSYTHDVLQSQRALANLFSFANPGARVVVSGLRLLPWWYGTPVNLWCCWTARHYLTTYRGLRRPWSLLRQFCDSFRIVRTFHAGTSFVAQGRLRGEVERLERVQLSGRTGDVD